MKSRAFVLFSTLVASATFSAGCLSSTAGSTSADGGAQMGNPGLGSNPGDNPTNEDAITYRDLSTHPGCTTNGLSYSPAQIPGYACAAKDYPPATTPEDTSKPIVLLVHGNSSSPGDWEICHKGPAPVTSNCVDSTVPMLSERLVAAGFHTFAVDMRTDMVDDPTSMDAKTGNPAKNMDHGWGVPIVQHFIESVLNAFPGRDISIVAFSYGPTVVRDALRRLHRGGARPFERIRDLVLASGAHHGVSTFQKKCADPNNPANITMAGRVACEMGNRDAYMPTTFATPLNGPNGGYETPCLDGMTAFGQTGVCGGHSVRYTTVVMRDVSQGSYQDEFVSESAAGLSGADNQKVQLTDQDQTGYFYNLFKNHFGSIRSEAGLQLIMNALSR